jgi:hypothetical protein
MGEMENALNKTPKHLILEDRVYNLSVSPAQNSERAFNRGLVDYRVEGTNPLASSDKWRTLLGMSEEIYHDYPGFRIQIPIKWILFRFLCHHVRANSIHVLKGLGGQVLMTTSFQAYLGSVIADEQADEPFCFVIMPFREKEFQQSIYFDVIKPLIEEEFKISCCRVDEDVLPDRIDNKIYSYILRAAFVIAEVTTKNPNVLYELGLSHMLEKDCIILTQTPNSEVPFDIN